MTQGPPHGQARGDSLPTPSALLKEPSRRRGKRKNAKGRGDTFKAVDFFLMEVLWVGLSLPLTPNPKGCCFMAFVLKETFI